jgi:hypothetical protein
MLRIARIAAAATLFLLPCFACFACGGSPSGESIASSLEPLVASATTLHFTTSSSLAGNTAPAVDITVTDPSVVRSIFQETLTQPEQPAGEYNCPADFGVSYHLVFTSGETTTTADIDPDGCELIVLNGASGSGLETSSEYWMDLAKALGIKEPVIYPYTPPGT